MQDDVAQEREELDDFDPLAELQKLRDSNLDQNQRKSVWTMKYRMKNELGANVEKDKLIQEKLLPGIREICLNNVSVVYKAEL